MKWNEDRSLTLSRVLVLFFGAALLALDLIGWRVVPSYFSGEYYSRYCVPMLVALYGLSVPAWTALFGLYRLLIALGKDEIYTRSNIRLLRMISWCCFAVALVSLLCFIPVQTMNMAAVLLLLPAAAALMGLIVRIVKNVFEQAADMKDELDLTV